MGPVETVERRFVRRPGNRILAGVAGGLADYTGTAPIWWRLGFVVTAPAGGFGIFAYLFLWWLMPRADLPRSAGRRFIDRFPDAPAWLGVGLLMFGAALLAGQLGLWRPSIGWAFLLIGLGVVLYRRDLDRTPPSPVEDPVGGALAPTEVLPVVMPSRRRRDRSWLGWLTLGIAMVVTGGMWMLRQSGAGALSTAQMLALPLSIIGAGLLAGSVVGRARATILLGLPLVPLVLVASVITAPLDGVYADRYIRPSGPSGLTTSYQQSGGKMRFDLTGLHSGSKMDPISVDLGVGSIQVLVDRCTPVAITGTSGIGEVRMLGALPRGGLGATGSADTPGSDPIRMVLHVGIGSIEVDRQPVPVKQGASGKQGACPS
jgi:phage shock protein PspC (stress-responsive transcriptional regulator)